MTDDDRLTTVEMAHFAARGFHLMEGVVPDALNEAFLDEVSRGVPEASPAGTKLSQAYPHSVLREVLAVPRVLGGIESLVGPEPLFDHQGVHFAAPTKAFEGSGLRLVSQFTHQDSTIDTRLQFDVQLMYYPQEVTPEMGGTRYVPGSHLRIVNEASIARYQNIKGQRKVVCPAGTVLFVHMGLWHGGELNHSDTTRFMLKVRLNPQVRQRRLWNTADLDPAMSEPRVIFDPRTKHDPNDVQSILTKPERWFELDTGRLEYLNRIRLWRFLLGDDSFDAHYWLSRLENTPS